MNELEQAARQALEALKKARGMIGYPANMVLYEKELALREALAKPDWGAIGREQLRRYKEKFGDFEQAEQEFTAEQQDRFATAFDEAFAKAGLPNKPVEQEPVAWVWACTECGTEAEDGTDCHICSSCGYHKFYKAPKVATCVCAAKTQENVKQEPVAWTATRLWNRKDTWKCPADIEKDLLYAAHVRTKDLTDIEYLQDAAPDLLEALQVLVRDCGAVDAGIELEPAIYQAQAAIAKATGGEV